MLGLRFSRDSRIEQEEIRGFDAFELRLGDVMRGERATLGKSLLDVERELKIKASYIAAIENADPSAFETPGFIPGYVRSYARYLGMEPDESFSRFCRESGFSIVHGMSVAATSRRRAESVEAGQARVSGAVLSSGRAFLPQNDSFWTRIEPGAVGSALVLVALISAIGYGGWSVLTQVQQVRLAPAESTPVVLTDLDPLLGTGGASGQKTEGGETSAGVFKPPSEERLSRLYRPKALDVPVMIARDAPISTLDPSEVGTLRSGEDTDDNGIVEIASDGGNLTGALTTPKVVADGPADVKVIAVRPAWVRIHAADGSVIFEGVMNAGDTYSVPATEEPAMMRVGESGAIYFAINGRHFGPAGARGSVTSGLELTQAALSSRYAEAVPDEDQDLRRYVAELQSAPQAPQALQE